MNPELFSFNYKKPKNENDTHMRIKLDVKCTTYAVDQDIDEHYRYQASYVDDDYGARGYDPFSEKTTHDPEAFATYEYWEITVDVDFDTTPTGITYRDYKEVFLKALERKLNYYDKGVTEDKLAKCVKMVKEDLTAEKANELLAEIQHEKRILEDIKNPQKFDNYQTTSNYSPTLHKKASKKLKDFCCDHIRELKTKLHR